IFPYPLTSSYPSTSYVYNWVQLNTPRLSILIQNLYNFVPTGADSATIADGLQSVLDNPDPHNPTEIVVIIANSDAEVDSAVALADQLKTSSTIITLSYTGDYDLSPLATSPTFTLKSTGDSKDDASLLLNSILQATCK
ncbi:hypothetical protein PFISCL1PPCAC_6207, partial [Pristionchus fissidentatus]